MYVLLCLSVSVDNEGLAISIIEETIFEKLYSKCLISKGKHGEHN